MALEATDGTDPAYEAVRRDGVLRVRRSDPDIDTEWLSTGWSGGRRTADCAYNVSVPDGWDRTDLGAYVDERLERAGFADGGGDSGDNRDASGQPPVLLTGVDLEDARGAQYGPVTVYATAGISNPAALPMEPGVEGTAETGTEPDAEPDPTGTVNLVVGTTRALEPGALANVIAVAAEAKAATLLAETGFPGTTTDAIVAGHDPSGRSTSFSGSGTAVGAATRACVRESVRASLRSHYDGAEQQVPASVDAATYGVSTDVRATVFRPAEESPEQGN
ncbi:adenosylcobinamide amidohydrolase [Halopiger xanaduensis]|uniref:Adenosylcobinamide hydrolase n=1 Tax=Halopiger xanaduensis (strain DSM 18323 / JCM 14033 / SH-6) TaxID=797210 RepID=F8D9C0_HALXS|nr:adenosylcobinamide amidohydrolase [Halopiger xanaduensis]AEH36856.1 Adenosylcobinamide hydrolase [Halopiger xanaduensis SH-6]